MRAAVLSAVLVAALPAAAQAPAQVIGPDTVAQLYPYLSPTGQATMLGAMNSAAQPPASAVTAAERAMRQGQLAVADALEAEPLDRARLARAVDVQARAADNLQQHMIAAMTDGYASLSPADRRALAADMRARPGRPLGAPPR